MIVVPILSAIIVLYSKPVVEVTLGIRNVGVRGYPVTSAVCREPFKQFKQSALVEPILHEDTFNPYR